MTLLAANVLQCIVNGEENPKTAPSHWHFVTLPEEDRATAIGNVHRKIGRDHGCGSLDILSDRQTFSSQYFATTPMDKFKKKLTKMDTSGKEQQHTYIVMQHLCYK